MGQLRLSFCLPRHTQWSEARKTFRQTRSHRVGKKFLLKLVWMTFLDHQTVYYDYLFYWMFEPDSAFIVLHWPRYIIPFDTLLNKEITLSMNMFIGIVCCQVQCVWSFYHRISCHGYGQEALNKLYLSLWKCYTLPVDRVESRWLQNSNEAVCQAARIGSRRNGIDIEVLVKKTNSKRVNCSPF